MHAYPIIDIVTLCGSEASQEHCFNQLVYMYLVMFPRPQNVNARASHSRQNKFCSLWHLTSTLLRRAHRSPTMTHGDAIITDEAPFVQHKRRLKYLKRWRELAIRPFEYECLPQDFDLLQHKGQDDCDVLMIRCLEARADMNNHLPPHEHVMDEDLVPAESNVENAGHGLFFRPVFIGPSSHFSRPSNLLLLWPYTRLSLLQSTER